MRHWPAIVCVVIVATTGCAGSVGTDAPSPTDGQPPQSSPPALVGVSSTDGLDWSRVPPEDLRGDRTEAGISVDSVAWLGDHWLALGRVWDYPDEIATVVAWTGR